MSLRINGEVVQIAQGAVQRDDTTFELEVEGASTVALQLTETDQTSPAGRYRLYLTGDEFAIQRAKEADLSRWTNMLKVTSDGLRVSVGDVEINFEELAWELTNLKSYLEMLIGSIPPAGEHSLVR